MSIQKNIGKNTIGDNKKMEVDLKTYNRSTHNLSTVVRNTQSAGTLVPTCTIVMQKDDTFEINIESSVLTHPTTGPLYGSFKLENHVFFIPFRLYNSWLHNNRLGIGLDMSQIKLPQLYVTLKKIQDQHLKLNNLPHFLHQYLPLLHKLNLHYLYLLQLYKLV